MIGKVVSKVLLLAAAVTVPAMCYTGYDFWKKSPGKTAGPAPGAAGSGAESTPGGSSQEPPGSGRTTAMPLEGPRVQDLAEVLHFDVTPEWIMRRWPRVSTGGPQLQFQSYRVPLVTGTAESDLAGALTYYFNPQQQVQRIAFQGTTGDPRNLVALVESRYHFSRRLTNNPATAVYEAVRSDGKSAGGLRVSSAGIVKAAEPLKRFDVELVLERPE
ncbi:MAG: DUF6690 family protein [Thermoguttaceae bacterium]|jgi:hypothetical protein